MEPVEEEQVRDQLVVGERRREGPVVTGADLLHHPRQSRSVELEQGLHDRGRALGSERVAERLEICQKALDVPDELARGPFLGERHRHYPCSPNIG